MTRHQVVTFAMIVNAITCIPAVIMVVCGYPWAGISTITLGNLIIWYLAIFYKPRS